MALEMRQRCERCAWPLAPDDDGAFICSYECTFCATCANALNGICPELQCGTRPPAAAQSQQRRRRRCDRGQPGHDRGVARLHVQYRRGLHPRPGRFHRPHQRESVLQNDPIAIVGAARTPMGGFRATSRRWQPVTWESRDQGGGRARRHQTRRGRGADLRQLPHGGPGTGTRPAGIDQGRPASFHQLHDAIKMCGSAMKAAMLAHDSILRWQRRHHGRGRHGKHEQCALPAAQGALRDAHGPRQRHRSHVSRRTRGCLRQGAS